MVLDIGTLGSSVEKQVIANATLTHFWQQRHRRQPIMIVIDEAHNICPQEASSPMQAISTETMIRIAGEGRKFGLYLLLASQRPNKIHNNVLSQCDNLLLMRMNSQADLAHLVSILSQIPPSLMEQATNFSIGKALVAGRIVQNPIFARFEGRLSEEGGGDIPTTWAARRESALHSINQGGEE
jgi:DNA helicase HerA-like ATPase